MREKKVGIVNKSEFQGVPLLDPGEQGRNTRSISSQPNSLTTNDIFSIAAPKYAKFLNDVVTQYECYFLPYPDWVLHSEKLFLWKIDESEDYDSKMATRLSCLKKIFNCPSNV